MARRQTTTPLAHMKEAASHLRSTGAPAHLTEAVEQATTVDGAMALLNAIQLQRKLDGEIDSNMNFWVAKSVRDELKSKSPNITRDANEAFEKYLAGEFEPVDRPRQRLSEEKVAVNVRPKDALRLQVAESAAPSWVVAEYVTFKYELGPYAPSGEGEPLPRGAQRAPEVPRAVRDAIQAAAEEAGRWVVDDVDEGFAKFLAGEFTPVVPVWTAAQKEDVAKLSVFPNDDLFERVKVAAKPVRPMQVAIAYLIDKYGIDPALTE